MGGGFRGGTDIFIGQGNELTQLEMGELEAMLQKLEDAEVYIGSFFVRRDQESQAIQRQIQKVLSFNGGSLNQVMEDAQVNLWIQEIDTSFMTLLASKQYETRLDRFHERLRNSPVRSASDSTLLRFQGGRFPKSGITRDSKTYIVILDKYAELLR